MASIYDAIRIETLVALALGATDFPRAVTEEDQDLHNFAADCSAVQLLAALGLADQHAIELQFSRFAKLDSNGQKLWLDRALKRIRTSARERERRFDPNIHPGHIVAALQKEPRRIQCLALSYIPKHLAWVSARLLGIDEAALTKDSFVPQMVGSRARIAAVIKQSFLWQFVTADMVGEPTQLDLLSGVELARLIRQLGVRQTAIACRGLTEVERVSTFLRRFTPDDAQSIAAHIAHFKRISQKQVELAERLIQPRLKDGLEAAAMLDRVGLCLIAVALAKRGPVRQRYTAQKLSPPAAQELFQLIKTWREFCPADAVETVIREVETLASQLRRLPTDSSLERRQTAAYTLPPGTSQVTTPQS